MGTLVVSLQDASPLRELRIGDPLDPSSYEVVYDSGETKAFLEVSREVFNAVDADTFVSVAQERDGQHVFVKLVDVARRVPVYVPEAEAKGASSRKKLLLYARRPTSDDHLLEKKTWEHADLAPRGPWTNYSVVPWLSLGRTQALILSDEHTLTQRLPRERIFEHLVLVVNCHEDRPDKSKYLAGAVEGRPPPAVMAHAVHKWFSHDKGVVEKNDAIQRAIWAALQRGTVAVHCLAGIHRAACIVACHFLYRHYQLGHTSVSRDCNDIYKRLQEVRPAVAPAYVDLLRNYEAHCKRIAKHRLAQPPSASSSSSNGGGE